MNYRPNIYQAVVTAFICFAFLCMWAVVETVRMQKAMAYSAVLFLFITLVITWMTAEASHYELAIRHIQALVSMDAELREMAAFKIPALGLLVVRGHLEKYVYGTPIKYKYMLKFLQESKQDQKPVRTPSKEDWKTADRPQREWIKIYDYLLKEGMVSEFQAGPYSYPYIGNSYNNLCVYYLTEEYRGNLDE